MEKSTLSTPLPISLTDNVVENDYSVKALLCERFRRCRRHKAKSGLNKSILDAAHGQFAKVLKYVAWKLGKSVLFVDPKGTSQHCWNCLNKVPKELSDRWHSCECGEELDRDENSAKLIKKIGLSIESGGGSTSPEAERLRPRSKKSLQKGKKACGLMARPSPQFVHCVYICVQNMRPIVDFQKIERLMQVLGREARGSGCIYFTGGASALLIGWRSSTVDIDIRLDPEPKGIFQAIAKLKQELNINIELASPQDFLPPLPGWRDRSLFIGKHGQISFYHYDFTAQALSKLSRAFDRDIKDVQAMYEQKLFSLKQLRDGFEAIAPELIRFPSLDPDVLRSRVENFIKRCEGELEEN